MFTIPNWRKIFSILILALVCTNLYVTAQFLEQRAFLDKLRLYELKGNLKLSFSYTYLTLLKAKFFFHLR